jgi:hypothetical protein
MLRSRRFVLPVRIVDLIHHLFGDRDALLIRGSWHCYSHKEDEE